MIYAKNRQKNIKKKKDSQFTILLGMNFYVMLANHMDMNAMIVEIFTKECVMTLTMICIKYI